MRTCNMIVLSMLVLAVCVAQDIRIQARPARPEKFENQEQVTHYIMELKKFLDGSTPRYGKRFSLPLYGNQNTEKTRGGLQKYYQLYKYYDNLM